MKALIQRVLKASVKVDDSIVGKIDTGLLIFLGIGKEDTEEIAARLINKILKLRIFSDENDKTNLSLKDVDGDMLVVSQFTLYADCKKNRPSFSHAMPPAEAENLYNYFLDKYQELTGKNIEHGIFGADMKVDICNDGPFTIFLEMND